MIDFSSNFLIFFTNVTSILFIDLHQPPSVGEVNAGIPLPGIEAEVSWITFQRSSMLSNCNPLRQNFLLRFSGGSQYAGLRSGGYSMRAEPIIKPTLALPTTVVRGIILLQNKIIFFPQFGCSSRAERRTSF